MPPETCLTCRHADMRRAIARYGAPAQSAYCNAPEARETQKYTTRPINWACDTGAWELAETRTIEARNRHILRHKGGTFDTQARK